MKIILKKYDDKSIKPLDLAAIIVFSQEEKKHAKEKKTEAEKTFAVTDLMKKYDSSLNGYLLSQAFEEGFNAQFSQQFAMPTQGKCGFKTILLMGMGPAKKVELDHFRKISGQLYKIATQKKATKIALILPKDVSLPLFDVVQASVEGLMLSSYRFDHYMTEEESEPTLAEVEIWLSETPHSELKKAVSTAQDLSEAVFTARNLINEGPLVLNPQTFAQKAHEVAKSHGLSIEVLDEAKMKKENMNLILAVGRASSNTTPPRLIRLQYKSARNDPSITFVGKGVTFDSGGLDIKTSEGMLDMKVDMSGAATVLGTMMAIAKLKPSINATGYLVCVENGVGALAYHPGDIIRSRKGITVEINNTDAEGRLILADAINYALEKDRPQVLIDIATLTGACMIALGRTTAGLFSNDDGLAQALLLSAQKTHEGFWHMPLNMDLMDQLKSPIADIKNCGERYGGAITGALFIHKFVNEDVKWAHLDIAGPATNAKDHPYLPQGGVGFGIRTLVDYVLGLAAQ